MHKKIKPLVSIIMPVYNAENYLAEAIESVLNQTYQNIELLVVNDASTDSSNEIIESYTDSRIRVFQNSTNIGYLDSVNFLFNKCLGDIIAFQDADDLCGVEKIEKQVEAFANNKSLMFCGTQCRYIKKEKEVRRSNFYLEKKDIKLSVVSGENVFLHAPSVALRKELLKKYGGYKAFYNHIGAEHIDWFLRMLSNENFVNLPDYLYSYRAITGSYARRLELNPLKFHSTQLALYAFWQRENFGSDFLESEIKTEEIIRQVMGWYESDPALIYRQAGTQQLAFGEYKAYLNCVFDSFKVSGLNLSNVKLLFLWGPLVVYNYLLPRSFQRKLVKRNNKKFIEKMSR